MIRFWPDDQIFETVDFVFDTLKSRLRELAFLNKGVRIIIHDERANKESDFCFEGGIVSFVKFLNKNKNTLHDEPIYFRSQKDTSLVEIAMQYSESYNENIYTYANNISTHEGGTHLMGFKSGLTRVMNDYARRFGLIKEKDANLSGEDIREGLTAVISVKLQEPQFEGQTKTKLGNSEIRPLVDSALAEELKAFLEENPGIAKEVLKQMLDGETGARGGKKGKGADAEKISAGKRGASREAGGLQRAGRG